MKMYYAKAHGGDLDDLIYGNSQDRPVSDR